MSQTPITVTYSLEEVLIRFEQKIDKIDEKIDKLEEKFDEKIDKLEDKFNEKIDKLALGQADIKGDIKALNEKVEGLGKRLDNQEFLSRGIVIGLGVAILGGFAKFFGWIGNP